jgi:hypothetical protein
MAKYINHALVLYPALNVIKNSATRIAFCNQQPTNYADLATSGRVLINKTGLTSANYTGPFDDTGNSNKATLTINATTGNTPSGNGIITYVVLTDGVNILAGTSVNFPSGQSVTTSQIWDSPAFNLVIADPI